MNAAKSPVAKSAGLYRRQSKAVPKLLRSASFILRHEFEQAKPFWHMETAALLLIGACHAIWCRVEVSPWRRNRLMRRVSPAAAAAGGLIQPEAAAHEPSAVLALLWWRAMPVGQNPIVRFGPSNWIYSSVNSVRAESG